MLREKIRKTVENLPLMEKQGHFYTAFAGYLRHHLSQSI